MSFYKWLAMLMISLLLAGCIINTPPEPPTEVDQIEEWGDSMNKALCIGINNYPGTQNDLQGCVNDMLDWKTQLSGTFGFKVVTLKDQQATKANFKARVKKLASESKPGDAVVITYSGHGSYTIDRNGDEADGKDETLFLYDGDLTDDEIRELLAMFKVGVKITVISDSCHSGTVTRLPLEAENNNNMVPRFVPPSDFRDVATGQHIDVRQRVFLSENDMNHILLSGCTSEEYSYDASFNGRSNGAMTYFAIKAIKKLGPNATWNQVYAEIRKSLPNSDYPQTPQLEGKADLKASKIFR